MLCPKTTTASSILQAQWFSIQETGYTALSLEPTLFNRFCQRCSINMTFEARVVHVTYFCSLVQNVSCENPAISLRVTRAACVKFDMESTWFIAPVECLMTLCKVANHRSIHPAHRSFSGHPSLPVMPHGTEMSLIKLKNHQPFIIDHSFTE